MPGEATIGALRVVLGADTAKFEDNLKSAVGSLESFGKKIATIATGVGIERAFEKAFSAIVESIGTAIDAADKLQKASQKFGIPVETLSALSNAAALSDVSLEQLGSSLSRVSKNMVAAQGPTSEQAVAFRALGINVKDAQGQLKNADDILLAVADSFSKFRDGTTKTALAVAIFGRAGADLIPLLDQGAGGINAMTQRMKELGLVISGPTAAAAERFNDDLKTLALAKDTIILKILGSSGMLEAMNKLTASMVEAAGKSSNLAENLGSVLGPAVTEVGKFLKELHDNIDGVAKASKDLRDAWNLLANAKNTEGVAKLGDVLRDVGITTTSEATKLKLAAENAALFATDFSDVNKALEDYIRASALAGKAPVFDPNAAKNLEEFNKALARLRDQALDASGIFAGQLAPGFLAATANMKALQGQITLTGNGLVTLGPQAAAFNDAMLKLQGTQLALALADPWAKFQAEIPAMTVALQAAGKNAEEVAALIERAAERAGVSWKTATADILANATTAFVGLAQKNQEFAGIAKGLSIAQATFSAYEAFNKALATYPPPFNFIGAGVALAAGLATVAKIQATQFAKGGSFMVPGGRNSLDSRMVPMALSAGERVDITPSNQANRGGVQRIELAGIGPRDLFTGDMVRGLVDALNRGGRDGYRLKVAER
jgi:hypothetical protein